MTRKKRTTNKGKRAHFSQTDENDRVIRSQGLGIQNWKQNSIRQPTVRLTSTVAGDDLVFVIAANANFMCMNLYSYDVTSNEYVNTGALVGSGPILWGEYAEQFQALAFLYELYRVNKFGFEFEPASFAGYGNQAGGLHMLDPTGVIVADVCAGTNLAGDLFRGISDAKQVNVVPSFKKITRQVDVKDILLSEQKQQALMTKDPESATLSRQEYQTGQETSPPQQERSYPPAVLGWMRFDIAGWDSSSGDRDLVLGSLKFHCDFTFLRRRIQFPTPDRLGKQLTMEYRLALAASFVGKPLQLKEADAPNTSASVCRPTPHLVPMPSANPRYMR